MNRRAWLLAGLAGLVVLALWYFFLWSPRNDDLKKAKDRTAAAQAANLDLESRIERLKAAQRDEPRLRARLERLRTAIPDDPKLAEFILDANDAAVRSGIDFLSIAPTRPAVPAATVGVVGAPPATPVVAGAAPAEIQLALQITGGYFQVLDFLNRLDALPRIVVTDGLTVAADNIGRLSTGVTARMFVSPLAVAPAPGTPGVVTTTTVAPAGATTAPGAGTTTSTAPAGATTTTTTTGVAR